MKPQYQHKVITSFFLWFDNQLLQKGEAYSNKTGSLYYYEDSRLPSSYKVYASPFKQWVTDSSVTGEENPIIPTSFNGSGRNDGIIFDFENGRIIETGGNFGTGESITGTFAVKDFNIYLTNDSEEDIILENKYVLNSRYGDQPKPVEPYDQMTPAIFINTETIQNEPFAFGGEDQTQMLIKAVVLAEDDFELDGVLSIFADSRNENIVMVPFTGYPITEYGDLKNNNYSYQQLKSNYKNAESELYIENVVTSKFKEKVQDLPIGNLKVGFVDFYVYQHRYPRL
jgi:hypothetical protein